MDKLPAQMQAKAGQVDMDKAERDIRRKEGIICSMTPAERRKPEIIKATRKRRIAAGDPKHVYAGEEYVIHDLAQLLGLPRQRAGDDTQVPLLMTRSGDQRAAVRIDGVVGSREIVVKSVGPQLSSVPGIFGATIAAGFFGLLIAPFVCKIVRFFPPLVTGTVITSIGLSLFPVAVNWAGGGSAASQSSPTSSLPSMSSTGRLIIEGCASIRSMALAWSIPALSPSGSLRNVVPARFSRTSQPTWPAQDCRRSRSMPTAL